MLPGTERTRLGLGGPGKAYGTFADKATPAVAATRITGLGLGGPWKAYGTFAAKSQAGDVSASVFDFITMARRRGRR